MLIGQHIQHPKPLPGHELGQARLFVLVGSLIAALLVDPDEAVEHEGLPGRPQAVTRVTIQRVYVHPDLVEQGIGHLRGDRSLPDHVVEPQLVAIESGGHASGGAKDAGRADRLVRLLRAP